MNAARLLEQQLRAAAAVRVDHARTVAEAAVEDAFVGREIMDALEGSTETVDALEAAGMLQMPPAIAAIAAASRRRDDETAPRKILPGGGARAVRKSLPGGEARWSAPAPFGPDGWILHATRFEGGTVVLMGFTWGNAESGDKDEWIQATLSWARRAPTMDDARMLQRIVFGAGWAYQMMTPTHNVITDQAHAVTLWGRADGMPGMPTFGTAPVMANVEDRA